MKHLYKTIVIMACQLGVYTNALSQSMSTKPAFIGSYALPISSTKTTNILFPGAIVSVDRGSAAVLARKASGVEHILQVKADRENFPETNLTVITADGKLYSFEVCYEPSPRNLNITFEKMGNHVVGKRDLVQQTATRWMTVTGENSVARKKKYGMQLEVHPIGIQEEVLYFPLSLSNHSSLSYRVQSLRFFVRDPKRSKRTAVQEVELEPLYIQNKLQQVKGNHREKMVVALPQLTLPDGKKLYIEVMEQGGGRHLLLKVSNRHLLRASAIQ
jgi:conjugative transposon TraN protein